jgi:hypothetical protein
MARLILVVAGLGFLVFGVALIWSPISAFAGIDMLFPDEALVRIELRAFYGGLELGLGALLVAAGLRPDYQRAGLWLCAASYGGIGLARLIGIVLEGGFTNSFLITALVIELGLAAAAVGLLLRRG